MLARIRLKLGDNEIEVDSRDFYVDNQTLDKIIDDMSRRLPEKPDMVTYEQQQQQHDYDAVAQADIATVPIDDVQVQQRQALQPASEDQETGVEPVYQDVIVADDDAQITIGDGTSTGLELLNEAEAREPEFDGPLRITADEIRSKLHVLQTDRFFDTPRTVMEAVGQLREYGWAASTLDVSKVLAGMAASREIAKRSIDKRARYLIDESLLVCR